MKAVMALFNSMWAGLMSVPMFDLPFTFGQFLVALCFLDLAFIIIRHALQNTGSGESKGSNDSNEE